LLETVDRAAAVPDDDDDGGGGRAIRNETEEWVLLLLPLKNGSELMISLNAKLLRVSSSLEEQATANFSFFRRGKRSML
jgi:hypothetical protein